MALPPWAAAEEGLGWPRGDCSLRWAMRPAIEVGAVGAGVGESVGVVVGEEVGAMVSVLGAFVGAFEGLEGAYVG